MKEIKAFVHRTRVADIVKALREEGYRNISVVDVRGLLSSLDSGEDNYSVELGDKVTSEIKLEVVCEDSEAMAAVDLICTQGAAGLALSGWVYMVEVERSWPIGRNF
ncbi:P-II family nitrogen regulator [Dyella silvatica]|uniref:P-II family nitrogen regulator n=1 Tax=Dyella silvatica TaxID=2992128 RepID=UPI002253889E|nr:P-II family nitrogen regulator [Dyella silvatica]